MTYSISPKKFSVESDSASKPNNHKSSSLEDSIESSKKLDNLNITEDDALSIEDGDVLIQALCASGSENLLMFTNARQTTLTLNILKLFHSVEEETATLLAVNVEAELERLQSLRMAGTITEENYDRKTECVLKSCYLQLDKNI